MIYRLFRSLAPRAGAAPACQCIGVRYTMARSRRAAADPGTQRGRSTWQAKSDMPQAISNGNARCETSRRSLRTSTLDQRRQIASALRVESEPAEAIGVSMSKEEHSEQEVMVALAQAVEGGKTEQGRADARKRKRAREMQCSPVHITHEQGQGGAELERRDETDARKGSRGTSKDRKAPSKAALEAEQQEDDIGISLESKKKRKAAKSLHKQQATVAEDESKAKPKQKKQRRAKSDRAGKAEMPEMPDPQQGARKAAAAAPRRRKAAERVDAGADMGDILDGEVAVAELVEADIEAEIELVDVTREVPPGKLVGAHVSMSNGIARAVINAASIGAKAFALDTRSKRQWQNPPLSNANAAAFRLACNEFGFSPAQILPHGSYLINLGSPDDEMLEKSYSALVEELRRCEKLGIELYNIHPGHHNRVISPEECMLKIAETINRAHKVTSTVCVVLENVAGGGSSVGHSFEQLRFMIDHVHDQSRVGVCLDTCHMFAAGYDISTEAGYRTVMNRFDEIVGWGFLKGMHINDSKAALGSKRDRHENIGCGLIGIELFKCLMNDPRLDGIPLIMETPSQSPGPKLNYPKSLLNGTLIYREDVNEVEESTDCRDVRLLYDLIK